MTGDQLFAERIEVLNRLRSLDAKYADRRVSWIARRRRNTLENHLSIIDLRIDDILKGRVKR